MAKQRTLNALIDQYYSTLAEFSDQYVLHEGAVSVAFQTLLADTARGHHWTLIPQLSDKTAGKSIRPDGTLKDPMGLVRGHWEAKDCSDDLDVEITRKIKTGLPGPYVDFVGYSDGGVTATAYLEARFELAT